MFVISLSPVDASIWCAVFFFPIIHHRSVFWLVPIFVPCSLSDIETVPPDLLTLTSACVKLRMTQQPPLHSATAGRATLSAHPHHRITSCVSDTMLWLREALPLFPSRSPQSFLTFLLLLVYTFISVLIKDFSLSLSPVEDDKSLCGTLSVAIHSAVGLQQPACMFVPFQ